MSNFEMDMMRATSAANSKCDVSFAFRMLTIGSFVVIFFLSFGGILASSTHMYHTDNWFTREKEQRISFV